MEKTLCEIIGQELFLSILETEEETSLEGNLKKMRKVTNVYGDKGLDKRTIETCVESTQNKSKQEGAEEYTFELDEHGCITKEILESGDKPGSVIKHDVAYGFNGKVLSESRISADGKTATRRTYAYDKSDETISSVILDEINLAAKGGGNKYIGNIKICDIIHDEDIGGTSKVIVTKIDPKTAVYEQGIYVFEYGEDRMLKKIYLQQPQGITNRNTEEHVIMTDDYVTVVSGEFSGEILTAKKILKFKRILEKA